MGGLENLRYEKYVQELIAGKTQRQAYREAFPRSKNWKDKTVDSKASDLLKNGDDGKVLERYNELRDRLVKESEDECIAKAKDVLKELTLVGFSNAADYAKVVEREAYTEVNGKTVPLLDAEGNPMKYRTVELELTENLTEEQQKALSVIKKGRDGLEQKPCDKLKALELLGRYLGMWNDKMNVSGSVEVNNPFEGLTTDQLKKMIDDG